jgi:hypothetical protein
MEVMRTLPALLLLLLIGCMAGPPPSSLPSLSLAASPALVADCTVTLGQPGTKPPPPFNPDELPVSYVDTWQGNDAIWIRLPRGGTIPASRNQGEGTLSAKFPWWRVVPGQLEVSASRPGGVERFAASVGTVPQYGPTGFVPSGLVFDGPGCWEVTGSLNGRTLTFVAVVTVVPG